MKAQPCRVPLATYRLQFSDHLTFDEARRLVDYLARLGVGDAYASPLFRARQSSSHGYDVIDHNTIHPKFGTEADFEAFATELKEHGMGLLLDIVPNHMGIDDPHNQWWQDVLENGLSSPHAKFFDIDWNPPKEQLRMKVLLPILGDQYGRVLEKQELKLIYEDHRLQIAYYDRRFPVAPRSWVDLLRSVVEEISPTVPAEDEQRMELESIITSLENLPPMTEQDPERVQQRYREKEVARRRLATLLEASPTIQEAFEKVLVEFNGRVGEPHSFDRLEALLASQAYRLCFWRVATDEINYRRFFDINELAAIRVEDADVFRAAHELVLRFVERGWVTGLRIDHPDGLLDPQQYFEDLQAAYRRVVGDENASLYVVVEKILEHDEPLNREWPVAGTTGYDYLNLLNGVFVDRRGALALRDVYARFTEQSERFANVQYESKQTILNVSMSSELHVLARQLDRISEQHRYSRDFTRSSLRRALREVIACFPVYRTYIRPDSESVSDEDRRRVQIATRRAKRRNPAMSPSFFDFIASVLLLEDPDGLSDEQRRERRQFVLKFQQLTGPVTAKGLEDTSFYRYYPLASLNEVGGDPSLLGVPVDQFHRANQERLEHWPYSMLATATHDTKRGEDVRARLNVLSEVPDDWARALRRWHSYNESLVGEIDGEPVPGKLGEYLLYQTLVGTWPLEPMDHEGHQRYVERIEQYALKAVRESKLHTSWLHPDEEYEQRVVEFLRAVLSQETPDGFLEDLDLFVRSIADAGFMNSLSQVLLKACSPGVPDFYQGTELWDFSLVDPDNRRPVDFERRQELLAELESRAEDDLPSLVDELISQWPDERIKLFIVWRILTARRQHADLFLNGRYVPLTADGERADSVCAFARERNGQWLLVVAPRWSQALLREPVLVGEAEQELGGTLVSDGSSFPEAEVRGAWWRDTAISLPPDAPDQWRHLFTDEPIEAAVVGDQELIDLSEILGRFPVAVLFSDQSST